MATEYWDEYSNLQHVKHELIRTYLNGWLPKLTTGSTAASRVLYFDTHAGRGRHAQGQLGSPLVALGTVLEHVAFPNLRGEVRFFFIEEDQGNLVALQHELQAFAVLPNRVHVTCAQGNCFEILGQVLDLLASTNKQLAPSFIFCDPFSFEIPGELLQRLMAFPRVELFVNVIWRELDMALMHAKAGKAAWISKMDRIFGVGQWTAINSSHSDKRADQCADVVRKTTKAKWGTHIKMLGKNGSIKYFLLHLTNHPAGRELMKECMWSCCPAEGYYARQMDNHRQSYLIQPEPDLTPVREWIINRLKRNPERWQSLGAAVRDELWLPKHVNSVVRELRKSGEIVPSDYLGDSKFHPKNNPLLSCNLGSCHEESH